MAQSVSWNVTIPVKGVFNVALNSGGVTKITCTKRGIYKLVARGGSGGAAYMGSEHEDGSSVIRPGVSAGGGTGGVTVVYRVLNVGDVIYYVGGGNGGSTVFNNSSHEEGAAGWNGGIKGKNHGEENCGGSGGCSYFMIGTPLRIDEVASSRNLSNIFGIAGGGGSGKAILGSGNWSASNYWTGTGGSGGGSPNGVGQELVRKDSGGQNFQPTQYASQFTWDHFGGYNQYQSDTWGGKGGAGYVCGRASNNYGGNGGVGWVNPTYASVTYKNKIWTGATYIGGSGGDANLNAGIYWEKTWISPLIYYGDREVDSVYYSNKEIDTIYYGNKELG